MVFDGGFARRRLVAYEYLPDGYVVDPAEPGAAPDGLEFGALSASKLPELLR